MEGDNLTKQFSKKNWVIIAIIMAVVCAVAIIVAVVVINANPAFKTSDNNVGLLNQLENEESEIVEVFNKRFHFLNGRYKIDRVVLLGEGEYAAVLLELDSTKYRAILEKSSSGWVVMGVPAVVLYYEDFPEAPVEVVRAINDLGVENDE